MTTPQTPFPLSGDTIRLLTGAGWQERPLQDMLRAYDNCAACDGLATTTIERPNSKFFAVCGGCIDEVQTRLEAAEKQWGI